MSEPPQVWPADADDDPSIPLLTERIFLPAVELDTALPASLAGAAAAAAAEPAQAVADQAMQAPSQKELAASAETPKEATEPMDEAASTATEVAIESGLDRDVVAAIDADFEELPSAERPPATTEATPAVVAGEATHDSPPADAPVGIEARGTTAAGAPVADETASGPQAEALRAAVLQRVMAGLPEQVNAAVRDLMQPAIDQAMAKLGEEAEVALRITLQDLVEQALREELRLRTGRPQS